MNMKVKFVLAMMAGFICAASVYLLVFQVGSEAAEKDLQKWIEQQREGYHLEVKEGTWQSHTKSLNLEWRKMKIELLFDTLLQTIPWQKDSLENHLQAYNVYDIYNRMPNNGWQMYPVVGRSLSQGLSFEEVAENQLSISIQTEIIAMQANNESKDCAEKKDSTCAIFLQTKIPFQIKTESLKVNGVAEPLDKTTNNKE